MSNDDDAARKREEAMAEAIRQEKARQEREAAQRAAEAAKDARDGGR